MRIQGTQNFTKTVPKIPTLCVHTLYNLLPSSVSRTHECDAVSLLWLPYILTKGVCWCNWTVISWLWIHQRGDYFGWTWPNQVSPLNVFRSSQNSERSSCLPWRNKLPHCGEDHLASRSPGFSSPAIRNWILPIPSESGRGPGAQMRLQPWVTPWFQPGDTLSKGPS